MDDRVRWNLEEVKHFEIVALLNTYPSSRHDTFLIPYHQSIGCGMISERISKDSTGGTELS